VPSRILLISPQFYGVENEIILELGKQGHEVTWIENRNLLLDYHGTRSKLKILRKVYYFLFSPHVRYLKRKLKKFTNKQFDILLFINGHVICKYVFRILKERNPELRSILYLWDASSMYSWKKELRYFDKVYSFDPVDSEELRIEYKPNFFIRRTGIGSPEFHNDFFFFGKFSFYRLSMIDLIRHQADTLNLKYFIKLWPAFKIFPHNTFIYNILKISPHKSEWADNYILNFEAVEGILERDYLVTQSVNFLDMQSYFHDSNVILDLPYPGQTGYTHLLIEAIGNGKKVITTNERIRNEPFYCDDQIRIIDSKNPVLDCEWIKERRNFKIDDYFRSLELSEWLRSLVNAELA
jgi:hypothetical protein